MERQRLGSSARATLATTPLLLLVACSSASSPAGRDVPVPAEAPPQLPVRPAAGDSPRDFARFAAAALDEAGVTGWGLALIQDGRVVVERCAGVADPRGEPVTGDTLFNAESIAKPVIAWGVMRLVEAGEVDLDAPVESYLRRFRLPPSDFDHRQVTVRRVLTHTSGLSWGRFENFGPEDELPTLEELLATEDDLGQRLRVEREPGREFHYSSGGYALLQLLVQDVSGRPFAESMRAEVLDPLGMQRTRFSPSGEPAPTFDGFGAPTTEGRSNDVTGNSLRTTLHDLTTFALAHLAADGAAPGRGVLSAATLAAMTTPAPEANGRRGLGYSLHAPPRGLLTAGHAGGGAEFRVVPETGAGIVLVSNSLGDLVLPRLFGVWNGWIQGQDDPSPVNAAFALFGAYRRGGVAGAVARYRALAASGDPGYLVGPGELALFARMLLDGGRSGDAIELFRRLAEEDAERGAQHAEVAEALASGRAPSPASTARCVGTYRAVSGATVTLALDGDELLLTIEGVPWTSAVRRISEHVSTFAPRGTQGELSGELVFEFDEAGQAVRLTIDDPAVTGASLAAERSGLP